MSPSRHSRCHARASVLMGWPLAAAAARAAAVEEVIVRRGGFLAASPPVTLSVAVVKRLRAGLLAGHTLILQRVTGPGTLFVHAAWDFAAFTLGQGEVLRADTDSLVWFDGFATTAEGRDLVQRAKRTPDRAAIALTAPAPTGGQSPAVVRIQARVRSVPLSEKRDQADRQDIGEYAHHDDGNTARSRRAVQPVNECHPARAVNHPGRRRHEWRG